MVKIGLHKSDEIRDVIQNKLKSFNDVYRSGPDLYFYRRSLYLNGQTEKLRDFLESDYNLEILYATLVSWDMNSRGAKMKYFNEFKGNILSLEGQLEKLWKKRIEQIDNFEAILHTVSDVYEGLHVMRTGGKLVSNSKLLHFIFPHLLMPMDRSNTLVYFYNHTNESKAKYLDLLRWSYDMVKSDGVEWGKYLDDQWNSTIPKILDNAIILKHNKSVKRAQEDV